MAAPKRNQTERVRDKREIARLYLREQMSQVEIVAILNARDDIGYEVSQQMVSYDLCDLRSEWLQSAMMDFNDAKARELARIDYLELVNWEAWERSREDAETQVRKTKGLAQIIDDGKSHVIRQQPVESATTIKGQAGDPRFLAGIQWCIERRCKILGVDAPTDLKVGVSGGIEIDNERVSAAIARLERS